MTDTEFFQTKNPHAPVEYCHAAAELYHVLLWLDAFENNIQIENYYDSFSFTFPNGHITIRTLISSEHVFLPHYIVHITGEDMSHFFDDKVSNIAAWLKENWNDLITGVKK